MCLNKNGKRTKAKIQVDSLVKAYPNNHYIQNVKGIVYKDLGLYHKNRKDQTKANSYLLSSTAAFIAAQNINDNLKSFYENNQALSLFYMNEKRDACQIWKSNSEFGGQNNLALLDASENKYSEAYHPLDSLYLKHLSLYKKRNKLLDHNKDLARDKTVLNNNYQFLTYYFLQEERPDIPFTNPFHLSASLDVGTLNFGHYIIEYSNASCIEKKDRRKVKKQKRKMKRMKKKKFKKGDCPSF